MHLAAKYGNINVTNLLLQRQAPVDAEGKNGVTPLHVAAHYDHQNVAHLLLDKVKITLNDKMISSFLKSTNLKFFEYNHYNLQSILELKLRK